MLAFLCTFFIKNGHCSGTVQHWQEKLGGLKNSISMMEGNPFGLFGPAHSEVGGYCTGLGLKNDQIFPFGESSFHGGDVFWKFSNDLVKFFSIVEFKGSSHIFLGMYVNRWYAPYTFEHKNTKRSKISYT